MSHQFETWHAGSTCPFQEKISKAVVDAHVDMFTSAQKSLASRGQVLPGTSGGRWCGYPTNTGLSGAVMMDPTQYMVLPMGSIVVPFWGYLIGC